MADPMFSKSGVTTVTLSQAGAGVEVAINDDGIGFDPNALRRTDLPRFGLATMRERAEAVGGTFAVSAVPGGGTRVVVRIPCEQVSTNRGGVPVARAHR